MPRSRIVRCLEMDMHIRAHRGEDSLILARPETDKRDVLAVQFEGDLNFLMSLHAGHSLRRGIDDVEVNQFRTSRYHKWKRLGQPGSGTGFADEFFQSCICLYFIWQFLNLPSGDFGPNK